MRRFWHWIIGHGKHYESAAFWSRCRYCKTAYAHTSTGASVRVGGDRAKAILALEVSR